MKSPSSIKIYTRVPINQVKINLTLERQTPHLTWMYTGKRILFVPTSPDTVELRQSWRGWIRWDRKRGILILEQDVKVNESTQTVSVVRGRCD